LRVGLQVTPDMPEFDSLRTEFLDEYERALDIESRLFDRVDVLLRDLQAAGLPWGVVTNKAMRFTEPVLGALGLHPHAAVVIAGDTTPHPKPHPAPLLEACRRLGLTPQEAVYVGD